jgi:hypothetical protein
LLHFALNRNGRGWEEAVPGKTGEQAGSLWRYVVPITFLALRAYETRKRVLPYIEKAVEERAKE